jgi:hypothetical protein
MSNWLHRQVLVWAVTACLPLFAQEFRAGISGIIKDPQGAAIPKVPVEALNIATSDISRTTTNAAGEYSFPVLPIGTYQITAEAPGFKKAIRNNLELRLGDKLQQDFTLEVGAATQEITVSAGTELLQELASDKGQLVSEQNVHDLPSVARNPFLLGIEAAGVQYDIGANQLSRSARPFDAGNNVAEVMSINGGIPGASDLLLDGIPNTGVETGSVATNQAFVPTPEAVAEFKMQSSNYDAQYGRTSGGTMTVSLKSGTNQLHGAVYWLNKNTIDEANTFDQNRIGKPRASFNENNPGMEFDGPVVIPHFYNGKNKTFFMYSYEIWRDAIPAATTYTVPEPAALAGNFNTTLQSNGQPITVYDPNTTTLTGTNTYTRTAFPGNIIPATRFNAVGAALSKFYPAPNVGDQTTYAGQQSNFTISPNQRTDAYDAHVIRVDHVINDKERFFARFVRGFRTEVNGTYGFPQAAAAGSGNGYTDGRLSQGGSADLTSVLSPSTVLTSRVGYLRHDLWITLYASGYDPTTLGFPQALANLLPPYFPTISPSGYQSFGASRSGGNQFTESGDWSWSEIVNRTIRRHSVKFGGEFRVLETNINSPTSNFGSYAFTAGWTQQNATSSNAAYGNSIASMLLGMPNSGSVTINPAYAYGNHYYGFFVQDDWRVTNKVTLSYGLRWDYESPITERNNQMDGPFNLTANSPIQVADPLQPGMTLKGGMTFVGPGNRMPYSRDLNNFQPRVGIAWHAADKTVVRAGYGLSYVATFTAAPGSGFAGSTPYNPSSNANVTFSGNYLNNPFPTGIVMPSGSSLGMSTYLGNSLTFVDPNRVIPRVHQFSIGVQRELPLRSVLEVSYVGSRSQEIAVSQNLDVVTQAQLLQYGANASPNLSDTCSATSTLCPYANPFYGVVPSNVSLGSSTSTTRQQLLLPYPQFTGVTESNLPVGKSWYNSLQVRWEKRLTHGLNVLVSYTHSKWMNATSYLNAQESITQTPDRTLASQDTPHRIVISGNWAIPLFAQMHGVAAVFLKGWQANGIFTREVGFPLAAPSGYWSTGLNPKLDGANETKAFNTCTILTSGALENCTFNGGTLQPAFIQQYTNTWRTLSGYFPTIRYPRVPDADVSLFKMFKLHETWNLQFRAEMFNATNSPQFNTPSTSLTSTSAGTVTLTQVNDQRNVQLSLRLRF